MGIKNKGFIGNISFLANSLNMVVERLCLISMVGMTFVVLLGVFFRYLLKVPLSWTEELSRYLMIWSAALAISIGVKENGHVGLTVLMDSAKSKVLKTILITVVFLMTLVFLLIMIFYSILMVVDARWQISQGLGISMVLPTLAIPVSMIIAFVQLLFRYILDLRDSGNSEISHEIIDI